MANELEFNILTEDDIKVALVELKGWTTDGPTITKTFESTSFLEAVALINRVATVAEKINHHPDMDIRYKNVTLRLWTHKKNAVTEADLVLAREIEAVA